MKFGNVNIIHYFLGNEQLCLKTYLNFPLLWWMGIENLRRKDRINY